MSGYVGRLALELAVTSLTCTVQLENVLLTVRPAHRPAACVDPVAAGDLAGVEQQEAAGCDAPAAIGLDDGVRVVAAGLETLLQRMTVNVSRLSVRLEGAPGVVACISCAQADYGTAAPAPDPDQVGPLQRWQHQRGWSLGAPLRRGCRICHEVTASLFATGVCHSQHGASRIFYQSVSCHGRQRPICARAVQRRTGHCRQLAARPAARTPAACVSSWRTWPCAAAAASP